MKSDLKGKEVVLTVPAKPAYLDTIRLALYGVAAGQQYTYEAIEDMKVAVTEACTYALLQLEAADVGALRLTFELDESELRVRIRPEGVRVAYGAMSEQAVPLNGAADLNPGRIGLFLMQALVDQVTVVTAEDGTEEVILCKSR